MRKNNVTGVIAQLLATLAVATTALSSRAADLSVCQFDGLVIRQVDKKHGGLTTREVITAAGAKTVNVLDGQRIIVNYPGGQVFANVKVEHSPRRSFDEDKRTILEQLELMARNVPDGLTRSELQPFEVYSVNYGSAHAPLGMHTLFDDRHSLVVTAYLFPQEEPRMYAAPQEYEALRERFLKELAVCAAE